MHLLKIINARIAQTDGSVIESDLAVDGLGKIERIDSQLNGPARKTLDAAGLTLLPGVIDPQVHFREPGATHKEDLASGSRSAVCGGTTSFLEMPNTSPTTTTHQALADKLKLASAKSVANYGFFIGATDDNLDVINTADPVCGIKIFMGSSTGDLLVNKADVLEKIFANGRRLIAVHAEDEERIKQRFKMYSEKYPDAIPVELHSIIRDDQCALIATEMALALSEKYERRFHILHLSTAIEVERLRKNKPDYVTAEAIPNHLLLNTAHYKTLGTRVQMNPPIRSQHDCDALWDGLKDGIIDIVATDHAPHLLNEKMREYPKSPSGIPGVATSLPLMLTQMKRGRCTLADIQKWMSWGVAQAYGIHGKGKIEEGWDADLVLVDLDNTRSVDPDILYSKTRWSPFEGLDLYGWPRYTIVNGNVVFEKGTINDGLFGKPLSFNHPE